MATYNASRPPTSIKTALNAPMETDGLIKPQKLKNPVVESAMHRAVTRELKINSKRGELIQNQKSELEKAWAKKGTEKTVSPNKELTELDKMLQRTLSPHFNTTRIINQNLFYFEPKF